MARFHHAKLPDHSTLLAGRETPNESGFRTNQLQIWYNNSETSWVGSGEKPHQHRESDEVFVVIRGSLTVEVEGARIRVNEREYCCFPRGVYHAIVEVHPPVETLMIRAPSVDDKEYQAGQV